MNTRRILMLMATLFSLAAWGQCDPLPLPYTTDLITGFHTPHSYNPSAGTASMTGWSLGANPDNCWLGYLWKADDGDDYNMCSGNFGIGGQWPDWNYYCNIGVSDSTHRSVAMLVAPEVEEGLAGIGLTMQLLKACRLGSVVCTNYCAYIDYGWVRDAARPMESFDMQGTLCIYTRDGNGVYEHNLSTDWQNYCFPVEDSHPAGSRFALRMRSELQAYPLPNGLGGGWPYTFCFKEFRAMNTACNPALTSDTVHLADSVCQHTPYTGYGIALSAGQTADTGMQTFTMRNFEYSDDGSCHEHVKVLTLKVLPSDITFLQDSIYPGEAYVFGGRELTLADTCVDDHGLNAYGCPVKDSLVLSIRPLPPMPCDAAIETERTEYYLTQPAEVHLWSQSEGTRYLWRAEGLTGDSTQRDAYVTLQPDSQQRVRLEVERIDTVNHIYRGASVDTTFNGLFQLTVPVEPQTRYLLEAVCSGPVGLTVYNQTPADLSWADSLLRVTFSTGQNSTATLRFQTTVPVRLSQLSLRRYCLSADSVLLVAHSIQPVIVAERNIICLGDSLVLHGEQTDAYQWASTPPDAALDSQQGGVVVVSPAVVTTYYLLWPSGTAADSLTVQVLPLPQLHIVANREVVDLGYPLLALEEQSAEIVRSRWTFSDGDHATGRRASHLFSLDNSDSVWVLAEGCNAAGCCSDTLLRYAVVNFSAWFPNAFTPGADNNNRFGLVTPVEVSEYEMFIYNRHGLLVYHSDDPSAPWDGCGPDGKPCVQAAYTYLCRFRLAGDNLRQQAGTVLLLR